MALTPLCRLRTALLIAALYAFGTCCWSVAAHCLWQHGPSLLFLTAALALLVRPESSALPLAGFFLGMAVWNRPTNAVFAVPLALYMIRYHRNWRLAAFFAAAAVTATLMAWYSWEYWGSVWACGQGHGYDGYLAGQHETFSGPFWPNLAGLLFSPGRGLFVFSPFLLFSFPLLFWSIWTGKPLPVVRYLSVGALVDLGVFAMWRHWWGGHSFGYRMLIEMLPALMLLTAVAWDKIIAPRWWAQVLFWPAVIAALYFNCLGAFYYDPMGWNSGEGRWVDVHPERLWDWRDSELRRLHQQAWHPPRRPGAQQ